MVWSRLHEPVSHRWLQDDTRRIAAGPHRLAPYEALKTITSWGAYQHYEEETKGTIAEGKLAGFVILD